PGAPPWRDPPRTGRARVPLPFARCARARTQGSARGARSGPLAHWGTACRRRLATAARPDADLKPSSQLLHELTELRIGQDSIAQEVARKPNPAANGVDRDLQLARDHRQGVLEQDTVGQAFRLAFWQLVQEALKRGEAFAAFQRGVLRIRRGRPGDGRRSLDL